MFKIEVTSNVVSGTYKRKTGEVVQFRDQEAYVEMPGARYPVQMRIRLEPSQAPHAVGSYSLSPKSFSVGAYGDLRLDALVLDPLPQGAGGKGG